MCGICGIVGDIGSDGSEILSKMSDAVAHRGPDQHGSWTDGDMVILGHRRLSIVDLSDAGRQPMVSQSARWVMTFNGEVYDHQELRAELEARGARFSGHSDSEVLLGAIDELGLEAALDRIDAMYGLALWDRAERRLLLARDPLGEKPLYYGWFGARFAFASELGALRPAAGAAWSVDQAALADLLRYKFVPAPRSMIAGVRQVEPGELVIIDPAKPGSVERRRHWSAAAVARERFGAQEKIDDSDAIDRLSEMLDRSVARRLNADVPVGAFLSGGIDSSTIAAVIARTAPDVHTFSIGFHDPTFDEAPHAAAVAAHLGVAHTSLYMGPEDLLAVVDDMADVYSEPFADSSQLPTTVLTRLARDHVTVVLSGDGGDEVFGGYGRYRRALDTWDRLVRIPSPARRAVGAALRAGSSRWPAAAVPDLSFLGPRLAGRALGVAAAGRSRGLSADRFSDFYREVLTDWSDPTDVLVDPPDAPTVWPEPVGAPSDLEEMMLTDLRHYLPSDILTKVDRAAMSVALEVRIPLLSREIVEQSFCWPASTKHRGDRTKWVLRQLAERHIPAALLDRPKQGFGVPLDDWLRGPLRQWADDLLDPTEMANQGLLRADAVQGVWRAHLAGRGAWSRWLWSVLMFEQWRRRWLQPPSRITRAA